MNTIRLILFALFAWIVWRFVKRLYLNYADNKDNIKYSAPKIAKHGVMVRCNHCGLHFPKEEAISLEQAYYCCEEHKQIAQQ